MKYSEDELFNFIKKKIPKNVSFIEEISDALNISYDAAYRRVNGKTTLSFSEALTLTNLYEVPLNELYGLSLDNTISVVRNSFKNTINGVKNYLKEVTNTISIFSKYENADLLYTAKDLPIYYAPDDSLFEKFKVNIFFNVLSDEENIQNISLKEFKLNEVLKEEFSKAKKTFKKIKITEIWNDTTINSTLYQIFYFYETKLATQKEAIQLCEELIDIIKEIEMQAKIEVWSEKHKKNFELYNSKLISLNNTIYLRSEDSNSLIMSYTPMSHLKIENEKICIEVEKFFKNQLQFSKKISGNAEVERRMFFTEMYDKIKQLKTQIAIKNAISFM